MNQMRRRIVLGTVCLLAVGIGLGAFALANGNATRADCPGKIVCPLTGELVCRDRCRANAAQRETEAGTPCCVGIQTPNQ